MELNRAKWTGTTLLLGNVKHSCSCLKYKIGSLKIHSKDTIYHKLDQALKFNTTKMQSAQDDQKDFIWVVMCARRVKEKELTNTFA